MKRLCILLLLTSFITTALAAVYDFDKIVLAPNIETSQVLDGKANKILESKLAQLVLNSGLTSKGVNDRFVITAHAVELESVCMPSTPTRYSIKLMLTIYVGDGEKGTLFSSYTVELKGIGNSNDDAYAAAYKRLNIKDPQLIASVQDGSRRIVDYYEANYQSIISRAKTLSNQGEFNEAIYELFAIPPMCSGYSQAQTLAGQLAIKASDQYNGEVITRARAAWAASPNENGSEQAQRILAEMSNPTPAMLTKAQQFTKEMATRLQNVEDQRLKLERLQAQYEHKEEMARIKADAKVETARINANARQNIAATKAARDIAVAYYNSRPRRVYHYYWW